MFRVARTRLNGDHSKSTPDALELGIRVYGNKSLKEKWSRCIVLPKDGVNAGLFHVKPIPLHHDIECMGFLIEHPQSGRILFAIDTGKIPFLFKDVSHFLIEANFDDDSMTDSIIAGKFVQRGRVQENHLSFDGAIDFLKRNINSKTRTIMFLHLSKTNSDYNKILSKAKKILSFENIYIADKGLEINIDKDLF